MIFLKEFGRCATTSEKCPNCGQLTNTSFSRLVKDSCGHTKCRMCLLYEEHGCKICQTKPCTQRKGVQDYLKEPHITNEELSDTQNSPSEEIVLPLELVINKDSLRKSKENHSDSTSIKCVPSNLYENITVHNNEETCESVTNDAVTNDSSKSYIPKIESYNVANIQNHLRNGNDHDSKNLQNSHEKNINIDKVEKVIFKK